MTDGRLLTLGALGALALVKAARGSRGVVRKSRVRSRIHRKNAMANNARDPDRGWKRFKSYQARGIPYSFTNDAPRHDVLIAVNSWMIPGNDEDFLWSSDDEVWASFAPRIWRAVWEGIVEGRLHKTRRKLKIINKPQRNVYGEVELRPANPGYIGILVRPDDEIFDEYTAFVVTADEAGFDEAMTRIDRIFKMVERS